MVEARNPDQKNRHVVKKENLPAINSSITLDRATFNKEVGVTAVKVPVM